MRYGSEQKAQTRERVLKEAAAAIRANGIDRTGVAQIMGRAGLTHGGFYAHFASKDDLITEAVAFMFEDRYTAFFDHLDDRDPAASLGRFIDRYLSMAHRNAADRGCPIPVLAGEAARLPAAARTRLLAGVERLTRGIASLLHAIGHADADATASVAISQMIGGIIVARLQRDDEDAARSLDGLRAAVKSACGLDR